MAMAKITTTTIAFLLIAVAAPPPPATELGRTPVGAPTPNCFSYLADAGDCLSFVENGSKLRKPDRRCCPELTNLTQTHPVCLCQLLFNSSQFDLSIDTDQALKLPPLCNISTPVSSCAALGVPVPGPLAGKGQPLNEKNGSPTIASLPSNHHFYGLLLLFMCVNVI